MKCFNCNEGNLFDTLSATTFSTKYGHVVIENIPCKGCDNCHEKFFDDDTMNKYADIKNYASTIKSTILMFNFNDALPDDYKKEEEKEAEETSYISYDQIMGKIDDMF